MKKVFVLAALAALIASPVLAASFSIVNSKHDLSAGSNATIEGGYNEICVYCHTPHGARLAGTPNTLPLWNRSAGTLTTAATDLYNSTTLDKVNSAPTVVSANVAASDAPLCFSCHDGTSFTKALQNPPNSGGSLGLPAMPANANLGTTLTNDHPIGMNYNAVQAADTAGFNVKSSLPGGMYFAPGAIMWCSSCHDVHNPGYNASGAGTGTQFMVTTMAGSLLCLECHAK